MPAPRIAHGRFGYPSSAGFRRWAGSATCENLSEQRPQGGPVHGAARDRAVSGRIHARSGDGERHSGGPGASDRGLRGRRPGGVGSFAIYGDLPPGLPDSRGQASSHRRKGGSGVLPSRQASSPCRLGRSEPGKSSDLRGAGSSKEVPHLTPWQGPRWSIFGGMKVKTSITLSRELLDAVDARTGRGRSRSEFIEAALQAFLDKSMRDERGARDLEILNRRATRLNREAVDVLAYQVIP